MTRRLASLSLARRSLTSLYFRGRRMTWTSSSSVGAYVRNAALSRVRFKAIVVFEWERVRVKCCGCPARKGEGHHSATTASTLWLLDAPQATFSWKCDQYSRSMFRLTLGRLSLVFHSVAADQAWLETGSPAIWSLPRWRAIHTGPQEWVWASDRHSPGQSFPEPVWHLCCFYCSYVFPLLHFLLDRWSPRRCCETIQHQVSHLLFRHSRNVSSCPHHCYFNVYVSCSMTLYNFIGSLFSQLLMQCLHREIKVVSTEMTYKFNTPQHPTFNENKSWLLYSHV